MTQEDKELLLIDLSARINYKVKCKSDIFKKKNLVGMDGDGLIFKSRDENNKACYDVLEPSKWNVKPYLRPMSSMAEEEYNELRKLLDVNTCRHSSCGEPHKTTFGIDVIAIESYNPNLTKYVPILINMIPIDWLNEHHFDYRGLITMGLALEASEGMYN